MTKLHPDSQNNFVSFIRQNKPVPPQASLDLEHKIMQSLEPQISREQKPYLNTKAISGAITRSIPTRLLATGFLFTTVSFGVRTPRVAIEPKDLENFLVSSWQDTVSSDMNVDPEKNSAYWLLPSVSESTQALSVSAP